ncbi:MAG: hypothetical protein Q8Q09_17965 [Deltaproteobacteria bacterium]|nr:hypothetical protein [Deltaproteobacteria bacterium]
MRALLKPNSLTLTLLGLVLPCAAHAQTEPSSQPSPTSAAVQQERLVHSMDGAFVTDVADAFDPHTTWAPRFTVGFTRSSRSGTLQRERSPVTSGLAPDDPRLSESGVTELDEVARYNHTQYILNLGAEIPVFHDLSFSVLAPLVLSDTRSFQASGRGADALRDGWSVDGMAGSLFNLPFESPTRSGIDQIRLGINWNILNQARDIHLPTWLLRLEARVPVGEVLTACEAATGGPYCPQLDSPRPSTPADSTDVMSSPTAPARRPAGSRSPGISRGVYGVFVQTIVSRRYGFFEPFLGIEFLLEIPAGKLPQFLYGGDRPFGQLASSPPIQGALTVGTEIVPWENRDKWQRFAIDLRLRGEYLSQGRDYTPLFDALGSSSSVPLSSPSWDVRRGMTRDLQQAIWFTGTTGTQSRARLGGYFALNLQADKHLRFVLGGSFMYTTPYAMTATDACNPNETSDNPADRGGCSGNSVPDPQHRLVIDTAGSRFRMTGDVTWDLQANLIFTPRIPW